MSWENQRVEVVLKHPVKWGEELVEKVILRPPVGKDLMKVKIGEDAGSTELLELAALVIENEGGPALLNMLHIKDALEVAAKVGNFFGDSL